MLKLGKKPATIKTKDLMFAEFEKKGVELKTAPVGFGHENVVTAWGMLGNDQYGDCVFAGGCHETMMLNAINGITVPFTSQNALADYGAVTGFDPATGANDDGTDVRTAMDYRRSTGLIDSAGTRHKIGGYVALEPGNLIQHLQALEIFDAVAIGIEFPSYAMDQFSAGKPWNYRRGGSIDGGHYIPIVSRPTSTSIDIITWGRPQRMSASFFHHYNDESYAFFTEESLSKLTEKTAEGYNLADLQSAINAI